MDAVRKNPTVKADDIEFLLVFTHQEDAISYLQKFSAAEFEGVEDMVIINGHLCIDTWDIDLSSSTWGPYYVQWFGNALVFFDRDNNFIGILNALDTLQLLEFNAVKKQAYSYIMENAVYNKDFSYVLQSTRHLWASTYQGPWSVYSEYHYKDYTALFSHGQLLSAQYQK